MRREDLTYARCSVLQNRSALKSNILSCANYGEQEGDYTWNFDLGGIASSLYNIVCAPFPVRVSSAFSAASDGMFTSLKPSPEERPQTRYYDEGTQQTSVSEVDREVVREGATQSASSFAAYKGDALFIGGNRSDFISQSYTRQIESFFPRARVLFLEGGHFLFEDSYEQFIETVVRFTETRD